MKFIIIIKKAGGYIYLDKCGEWPENMTIKQAWLLSLQKWLAMIVFGFSIKYIYEDSNTCALCYLYAHNSDIACYNCPVAVKTGKASCFGTPWQYSRGTRRNIKEFLFLLSLWRYVR